MIASHGQQRRRETYQVPVVEDSIPALHEQVTDDSDRLGRPREILTDDAGHTLRRAAAKLEESMRGKGSAIVW